MIRKLSLAALALACLAASIVAPAAAWAADGLVNAPLVAPLVVTAKTVALPWGDWAIAVGHELAAVVVPMLGALVMWAIHRYVPVAGLFVTQGLVDRSSRGPHDRTMVTRSAARVTAV